jgi:hypothetical protein
MSNPFDYVNSILENKKKLITDDISEKEYSPFLTNRSLSYHKDCIMYANEMNKHHFIDNKLQFDFLLNTIRSRKRPFIKWVKPEKSEDIECIKTYFGFSDVKAREVLTLLNEEQIQSIKEGITTGGIKNTK